MVYGLNIDTFQLVRKLTAAGLPEDAAVAIADCLNGAHDPELATKTDLDDVQTQIADIRTEIDDIRTEITDIRTEINDIRTEIVGVRSSIVELKAEMFRNNLYSTIATIGIVVGMIKFLP